MLQKVNGKGLNLQVHYNTCNECECTIREFDFVLKWSTEI